MGSVLVAGLLVLGTAITVGGFLWLRGLKPQAAPADGAPREPVIVSRPAADPLPASGPAGEKDTHTGEKHVPAPPDPPAPRRPAVVSLPSPLSDMMSGGGRYLVVRLKAPDRLLAYDVAEGKALWESSDLIRSMAVAVGREKLFVSGPESGRISRVDLRTGKQEATVVHELQLRATQLAVAAGADGPLVTVAPLNAGGAMEVRLYDPATLTSLGPVVTEPNLSRGRFPRVLTPVTEHLGVSADGRLIGVSNRLYQRTATGYRGANVNMTLRLVPGPDGRTGLGADLYLANGHPVANARRDSRRYFPAAGGPFFVFAESGFAMPGRVALFDDPDAGPIGNLPLGAAAQAWLNENRGLRPEIARQLAFFPDPGVVAFARPESSELHLEPVDLPALLRAAGRDVVFTSVPPAVAPAGRPYAYTATAVATDGTRPTFSLLSGPPGTTVSPDGKVAWPDDPAPSPVPFAVRIAARAGGKEAVQQFEVFRPSAEERKLAANPPPRATEPVVVRPRPPASANPPPAVAVAPANPDEVPLPGAAVGVTVGGAGRYVLAAVPSAKQVAVFDAAQRKLVTALPTDEGDVHVAAGLEKAFVLNRGTWLLQRWDLATQALELTVPVPPQYQRTYAVAMGSAATGPLWLVGGERITPVDPWSLRPSAVEQDQQLTEQLRDREWAVQASADGRTLGIWQHRGGGRPGGVFRLTGQKLEGTMLPSPDGHLAPGPDGQVVYAPAGRFDPNGTPVGPRDGKRRMVFTLPAAEGSSLYLTVTEKLDPDERFPNTPLPAEFELGPRSYAVHRTTDGAKVAEIPRPALGRLDLTALPDLTLPRRFMLLPSAGLLVALPAANNKLLLRPLDLDAGLAAAGKDYLFVDAPAGGAAVRGRAFTQALTIKSGAGGVRVKVDAGPPGLAVAADGKVTWAVPKDFAGSVATAALTVTDAGGKTVPYALNLAVRDDRPAVADAEPRAAGPAPAPVALDLPGPVRDAVPAAGGKLLALHLPEQRQVALFDPAAGVVVKYVAAPEEEAVIAAGRDHLYVASPGAKTLRRYSLKTFEKEATAPLPGDGVVTGLCMGAASPGPLLICRKGNDVGPLLVDPLTLKPLPGSSDLPKLPAEDARASADGRIFVCRHGTEPATLVEVKDGEAEVWGIPAQRTAIVPSADGRRLFFGPWVRHVDSTEVDYDFLERADTLGQVLPAVAGGMVMRFAHRSSWIARYQSGMTAHDRLDLFLPGQRSPFAAVERAWEPRGPMRPADLNRAPVADDRRVHLFPESRRLVVVMAENGRLVVHPVGIDELLARSPVDYLVVASAPPAEAVRGATLAYGPVVRSRKGGVQLRLRSGPPGMTLTAGQLIWEVPANFGADEVEVVVAASNAAGQEVTQTFTLPVRTRPPAGK